MNFKFRLVGSFAILILSSAILAVVWRAFSGKDFSMLFGSSTNDVVARVAKLSESHSRLIVRGVDFSPDGALVAVDSSGEQIEIWDWKNQRIEAVLSKPEGANDMLSTGALQFSSEGKFFASCVGKGAGDAVIRVWSTHSWIVAKDVVDAAPGVCDSMAFSTDGKFLFYVIDRVVQPSQLIAYSVDGWEKVWSLVLPLHPAAMDIRQAGDVIAIGGIAYKFPTNVVDPVKSIQQSQPVPTIVIVDLDRREIESTFTSMAMGSVAWSADGGYVAVAGRLNVEMIDVRSGQSVLSEYSADTNVKFTGDGRFLLESGSNESGRESGLKIWDAKRQKLLQRIDGAIGAIAVSRSGKFLAVGEVGRTTIWQFK